MADENNSNEGAANSTYPNYGLSVPASVAINTVVTGQYTLVEMAGAKTVGRLGSRLIDRQSQKMTLAARATAERKVFAHRS